MKFEDVEHITVYKENGDLIVRFFEDEEGIKALCKDGYLTDIAEKDTKKKSSVKRTSKGIVTKVGKTKVTQKPDDINLRAK